MFGELAVITALCCGGWCLAKLTLRSSQQSRPHESSNRTAVALAQRRYAERVRQQRAAAIRRQLTSRNMQLALLQLRDAPDFRRAAGYAELARDVPVAFRKRQFRRFRPQIVATLAERLQAGATMEQVAAGLTELVTALGFAAYESEYVITEARGRRTTGGVPSFAERVQRSQAECDRRMEAIRNLPELDPDLREQLLEMEQQRLRDQLMTETEGERAPQL